MGAESPEIQGRSFERLDEDLVKTMIQNELLKAADPRHVYLFLHTLKMNGQIICLEI